MTLLCRGRFQAPAAGLFALSSASDSSGVKRRRQLLGVDRDWGPKSCLLFGLAHAFDYSDSDFSFELLVMALTAIPSFITSWIRLLTGSLLLPILPHNFGNSSPFPI